MTRSDKATLEAELRSALEAGGARSVEGGTELQFLCPAHEDSSPSAYWNAAKGAWHCQSCGAGGGNTDLAKRFGIQPPERQQSTIERTYDYRDEQGALLYQTVRYFPKTFKQRQPAGAGDWKWDLAGVRRVLYRLPELLESTGTVYIVEGEKDVETLRSKGLTATCNVGGAGKWRPEYNAFLSGRQLVVLPDNDKPGMEHAQMLSRALKARVVALPGLPQKGDVTDWFNLGGELDDFLELCARVEEEKPKGVGQFDLTDAGNAEVMAHLYGDAIRYDHQQNRWLRWNQHRWGPDDDGQLWRWALTAARERARSAADLDGDAAKRAFSWAKSSESTAKISAMLTQLKAVEPVADNGKGWDANPMLLGVNNGVVNLVTGELRAGLPSDRITMSVGIDYDPRATAPKWLESFADWFEHNVELMDFVHKAVGYSLTGSTKEQCFFLCYGGGRNGKSKFITALSWLGGEYWTNIDSDTLKKKSNENHPAEIAALVNKRIVTCGESPIDGQMHDSRVKGLTGGDVQTARVMRGDPFTFIPVLKLWMMTNNLPANAHDDSDGFWRRPRVVPFNHQFTGADDDKDLEAKLRAEIQGILAWAVKGAMRWAQEGLKAPLSVMLATLEYKESQDPLADFIAECCHVEAGVRSASGELYKAYLAWADSQGLRRDILTNIQFGRKMAQKYQKDRGSQGTKLFSGIRLLYEDERPDQRSVTETPIRHQFLNLNGEQVTDDGSKKIRREVPSLTRGVNRNLGHHPSPVTSDEYATYDPVIGAQEGSVSDEQGELEDWELA